MNRRASLASWVVFTGGIATLAILLSGGSDTRTLTLLSDADPLQPASADMQRETFPVGQPVQVSFDAEASLFEQSTPLEKLQQQRDWLFWLVTSESTSSADQLSKTLYDVPVVRHSYVKPVTRFEYGATRSTLLENEAIIALVPEAGVDQRADDLAYIADEHRKNLGRIPQRMHVFEYRIGAPDTGTATVVRRDDVAVAELFSERYGYHEAVVRNREQLAAFMAVTNDLVYAKPIGGGLKLGGRKLRTGGQNIRPMDAAVLWQAAADVQRREARIEPQFREFQRTLARRERLLPLRSEQRLELERDWLRKAGYADGVGFSLDPTFDYALLADLLARPTLRGSLEDVLKLWVPNPQEWLRINQSALRVSLRDAALSKGISQERFDAALSAVTAELHDLQPLQDMIHDLQSSSPVLAAMVEAIVEYSKFQVARYDGPLAGTEVGMVLFYTDLTAKLWAIDFRNSTPSSAVADFLPMTRITLSRSYEEELYAFSQSRLWFGTNDRGYQFGSDDDLLFARNATRLYSRSRSSALVSEEVAANPEAEAFLGWWNDHYEAVARHEPLYQQLNEIMKWSLLNAWLVETRNSRLLSFLESVSVDHSAWFPDWARANAALRFHDWRSVPFFEKGNRYSNTEALPLLRSYDYDRFGKSSALKGGVSLASKSSFANRAPLSNRLTPSLRRSDLDYARVVEGSGDLRTLRGASYGFQDGTRGGLGAYEVRMTAEQGAKLRGQYGDVASANFVRATFRSLETTSINLSAANVDVGTLSLGRTGNGLRVSWRAREADNGFTLVSKMSGTKNPGGILRADPNVASAVEVAPNTYYVQLVGSKRWLKVAPEASVKSGSGTALGARVAGFQPGSRTYSLAWLDEQAVPESVLSSGTPIRGPPRMPRGPAARAGATAPSTPDGLLTAQVADRIVRNPAAWVAERNSALAAKLDEIDAVTAGRADLAQVVVGEARLQFGNRPELLIREALAELKSGNVRGAARALDRVRARPEVNSEAVLKELDARLAEMKLGASWGKNGAVREAMLGEDAFSKRIAPGEIKAGAPIYVEDAASLNNLDLPVGVGQSIQQLNDRGIARIYAIPYGRLRGYRPQRLRVEGRSYDLAEPSGKSGAADTDVHAASGADGSAGRTANASAYAAPTLAAHLHCFENTPASEDCPDTAYVIRVQPRADKPIQH